MSKLSNIGKIIGFAINYAPIIITVVKALQMVQDKLNELDEEQKESAK